MGSRYECFLIEPTGRVRQELRIYSAGHWDTASNRYVYESPCPRNGGGAHNAAVRIEDAHVVHDTREGYEGYIRNGASGELDRYAGDPRWPTHCACGYAFTEHEPRQVFCNELYRRAGTGEEVTLRDATPGALVRVPWMARFGARSQDSDPAPLAVVTPGGLWTIDECASDCPYRTDWRARPADHRCWTRTGETPFVTARPSIRINGRYHGFLTAGWLEEC